MRYTNNTKPLRPLSALLMAGLLAVSAAPSFAAEKSPGYQYDAQGQIMRDASGKCMRTGHWAPANAIAACDPDVAARVAAERAGGSVRENKARTVGNLEGTAPRVEALILGAGDAFAFNSAELSQRGKGMLAIIVDKFKDDYIRRVGVVGYTDRIGNPEYNLKLSERRANAVKDELVSLGIPEERITVVARGSADPIVTCEGIADKQALIACLAPNRRTEVVFVIPSVKTETKVEFVERRRGDIVKEKDVSETATINSPMINAGFNKALKTMGDGCSKEIAAFCNDVVVGDYRLLNCLKEHKAEWSPQCATAVAKAEADVEEVLGNANFFGAQCGRDIKNRCADVSLGQGDVLHCLQEKIGKVTKRCVDAMLELHLIGYDPFGRPEYQPKK